MHWMACWMQGNLGSVLIFGYRWDKKTHDAAIEQRKEEEKSFGPGRRTEPASNRDSFSSQAKAALEERNRDSSKVDRKQLATLDEDEWEEVDQDEVLPTKK